MILESNDNQNITKLTRKTYSLPEARETLLNKDFTEDDFALVKLNFTFEESQNKVTKKWIKSMIVQNLT
jgi:hypothetical protein